MIVSKRFFLIAIGLALIVVGMAGDIVSAQRPNILFIGVDDLRPELGCYGAEHIRSPNIDQLALESTRFDHAYCQQAVCLPSRISLFTGMHPESTGVHDLHTHFRDTIPNVVTLTEHLGKHGYKTIGMGKVYHDEQKSEWDRWINPSKNSPYHRPEILTELQQREAEASSKGLKGHRLRQYTKGPSVESADRPDIEYEDGRITQTAIKQMRKTGKRPFFLTVGYRKPHLPFIAPKRYWDRYNRNEITLPNNYFLPKDAPQISLMNWGELRAYSDIPSTGPVPKDKARELIHGYYACISFIDEQIGLLLRELKKTGLEKNTIVVLWSDHGWKLGEHAMWCKHTNFEIDARVPLLIRMPNAEKGGKISSEMVELVDLYPTLCELAGIKTPSACEGRSLAPILRGEKVSDWRQHALSQYKRSRKTGGDITGYSIKYQDVRYTEWINNDSGKRTATEFYDHQNDPNENTNAVSTLSNEQRRSLSQTLELARKSGGYDSE
jgi:arylsulfatase A-like enzyme